MWFGAILYIRFLWLACHVLMYSWLPYPPYWPFWYWDQNTLLCFCFFPLSVETQLVEFVHQGSFSFEMGFNDIRVDFSQDLKRRYTGNDVQPFHVISCASPFTLSTLDPLYLKVYSQTLWVGILPLFDSLTIKRVICNKGPGIELASMWLYSATAIQLFSILSQITSPDLERESILSVCLLRIEPNTIFFLWIICHLIFLKSWGLTEQLHWSEWLQWEAHASNEGQGNEKKFSAWCWPLFTVN